MVNVVIVSNQARVRVCSPYCRMFLPALAARVGLVVGGDADGGRDRCVLLAVFTSDDSPEPVACIWPSTLRAS